MRTVLRTLMNNRLKRVAMDARVALSNEPRARQRHADPDHAQRSGNAHGRRGPRRASEG